MVKTKLCQCLLEILDTGIMTPQQEAMIFDAIETGIFCIEETHLLDKIADAIAAGKIQLPTLPTTN